MYQIKDNFCLLGIESSCDDTGAAVIVNGKICSNIVATQLQHTEFGGVVPEIASRAHLKHILPVVNKALIEANISLTDLDGIAYANGPGLMGSLMVGSAYARALSLSLGIPVMGINHLKAHVMAHFIDNPVPEFPFLCLLVSGGHTQIILVNSYSDMEILGQTRDDAAGEAFDKTAKMMKLPYPGGPLIDKYAASGDPLKYNFSESKMPGFDYSFSGFKTAVLYFLNAKMESEPDFLDREISHVCASVQNHIVKYLIKNLKRAAEHTQINRIALAGGVAANSLLRSEFEKLGNTKGWKTFIPAFKYCTDNAGMIAMAGHFAYKEGVFDDLETVPFAKHSFT